jgi:hypothetical protein
VAETVIGVLIGAGIIVAVEVARYQVWLYHFNRRRQLGRELWFKEHRECCELDQSYLTKLYG